jgi:hypothetical protein
MILAKKKSKLVDYELHKIMKNVFAVKIDDQYQRAMLFVRYQEFYESPYKQFQGKHFNIFEFMDHYMRDRGATHFTYPKDWCGYNIPSEFLLKCFINVGDPNPYDEVMSGIIGSILKEIDSKNHNPVKRDKFYLIGVDKIEGGVMDHEIAHALFYINPSYKKEMKKLVEKMPKKKFESMKKILLDLGYREAVIVDEIQAFMSTGLWEKMRETIGEKDTIEFVNIFQKYRE